MNFRDLNSLHLQGHTKNSNANGKPEKAGRWTLDEHEKFLNGLTLYGKDWRAISKLIATRSITQVRTHAQKYFARLEKLSHGDTSLRRSINDFNIASVEGLLTNSIIQPTFNPTTRSDSIDDFAQLPVVEIDREPLVLAFADNIIDYHHRNYDHHCLHGHIDDEVSKFIGQEHIIVKSEHLQIFSSDRNDNSSDVVQALISQSSSSDNGPSYTEDGPPLKKLKSVTDLYIQRSESVKVFERILNFSSGSLVLDDEFWNSDDNDD